MPRVTSEPRRLSSHADDPRAPLLPRVIVGATILVGLFVVYRFRAVFGPMLLALALAYIYEPMVLRLCRRGWRREIAATAVFLATSLLGVLVFALLLWQAAEMIGAEEGPLRKGIEKLVTHGTELIGGVRGAKLRETANQLLSSDAATSLQGFLTGLWDALLQGFASALNLLSIVLLLPVYLIYLMLALPEIWSWITAHLPSHDRARTLRVLGEIHVGLAAFLRGRVVVAILKGALTALGLTFCGTPAAIAVGLLNGLLSVLPYVGPIVGFLAAAALTAAEHTELTPVIWVAVVFVIAEALEGFVLFPLVMGQQVALHPLTMLISVVFWAYALGLFGAFVAIPLTLVVKIVLRAYVLPSVQKLAS